VTYENLINRFLMILRTQKGYSPRTIESYETDLKSLFRYLKKNGKKKEKLSSISSSNIEGFRSELLKSGLSNRSVNRKISAIRSLFRFLTESGVLASNPALPLKQLKQDRVLPKYLEISEVESLLEVLHGESGPLAFRNLLMVDFMYNTGLRVSELITLKRHNLHLKSGYLNVEGKGGKQRLIPFPIESSEIMLQWIESERSKICGWADKNDYLFCNRFGKAISRQGVWKMLKKTGAKAGIIDWENRISPHVLRHSFATHLLNHGFNLKSLQEVLGHSDISSTQIYTHLNQLRLKEIHGKTHPRG